MPVLIGHFRECLKTLVISREWLKMKALDFQLCLPIISSFAWCYFQLIFSIVSHCSLQITSIQSWTLLIQTQLILCVYYFYLYIIYCLKVAKVIDLKPVIRYSHNPLARRICSCVKIKSNGNCLHYKNQHGFFVLFFTVMFFFFFQFLCCFCFCFL